VTCCAKAGIGCAITASAAIRAELAINPLETRMLSPLHDTSALAPRHDVPQLSKPKRNLVFFPTAHARRSEAHRVHV
jgi:hypothetical protein